METLKRRLTRASHYVDLSPNPIQMCRPCGCFLLRAAQIRALLFVGVQFSSFLVASPGDSSFTEKVARVFSQELQQLDTKRVGLVQTLAKLPVPARTDTSRRLGWHTPRLTSAGAVVWVQIDLGEEFPIDTIALVAASGEANGHVGPGYGFPLRFRVEISQQANFSVRETVADYTAADVTNPGAFPFVMAVSGRRSRYVRVTATQAWPRREDWIVALGEILVLSGSRNVAAGQPVTSSASAPALPAWDVSNVTDGQSVLGPPVQPGASPTNGYLAVQEADPQRLKWVQVDLGTEYTLEEVRLFPARPTDFADTPGSGFPARFQIAVALDPELARAQLIFDSGEKTFVPPGDNALTFRARGQRGRYVRVTALQLHDRGQSSSFALAELEAWAEGRNVAFGAKVSALDRFEDPAYPRWHPEFLVDGYNSRQPVIDWPQWIAGLARRREIEEELFRLDSQRAAKVDGVLAVLVEGAACLLGLLAVGLAIFFWRARTTRKSAVEELRRRIARDLHDEIGSHLGSIGLLSEAARRNIDDEDTRGEFAEIGRIATRTNESLRDIVWLLDSRPLRLAEIAARIRDAANSLRGGVQVELEVSLPEERGSCSLEFTRDLWLIFKETLYNAVRHSGSTRLRIAFKAADGLLTLRVADDGRGFCENEIEPGRGLHNLRLRAMHLKGALAIESSPGKGTVVSLQVPYP